MFYEIDKSLFYLINNGCSSVILDRIMPVVSNFGQWEYLVLVSLVLLLFRKKEIRLLGLLLLIGLLISEAAVEFLKSWVARPRPFMALPHVHKLAHASQFSFPSGHSTRIFLFVSVLTSHFKKYRFSYILAVLVAFSRVYLGVHYPSDVLAGAFLGFVIGESTAFFIKKIPGTF